MTMYLATGAGGMVGSYLPTSVRRLRRQDLDVSKVNAVHAALAAERPDVVIHLAAATDVDRAEEDRDYAFQANTLGTMNVALACRSLGVRLVYVSTGGVFDGTKMASTEEDPPRPRNFYAWTKYEGERIVADLVPDALIVRAGWVMGGGAMSDHKFVGALVRLLRDRDVVEVVADRYGSPTYARHLVGAITKLVEMQASGIWHCANEGVCSRFEIAGLVAQHLDYRGALVPVDSDRFPTKAPRGVSEGLDCSRLRETGICLPPWRDAVVEYLEEFKD